MYETYKRVKYADKGIEAEAQKIEDDVWRELTDETTRHTIDMIVKHVQALEDKVDELERHLRGETPWISSDGDKL